MIKEVIILLAVLIGELISLWYGQYSTTQVIVNILAISVLIILRIITTKYSPICADDIYNYNFTYK